MSTPATVTVNVNDAYKHLARLEDGIEFCDCGFFDGHRGGVTHHLRDIAAGLVAAVHASVNRRAVVAAALRMGTPARMIAEMVCGPRAGSGTPRADEYDALHYALSAVIKQGDAFGLAAVLDVYEERRVCELAAR